MAPTTGKVLRVGYQNVCNSSINTHTLLEWAFGKEIDILFVGEMWVEKRKGNGTQTHGAFTLGSEVKKRKRVAVYWWKRLDGEVEVIRDEKNVMMVNV